MRSCSPPPGGEGPEPPVLPGDRELAPARAARLRHLLPSKFKLRVLDPVTFDVEPGLERYSRSRVMDEREDPGHDAGRPPRHAARAPQRLVRLSRWADAYSSRTRHFWAAAWPGTGGQAGRRDDPRPGHQGAEGAARAHRVRAVGPKYSILSRIVRATQVDTIVHTFLETNSSAVSNRVLHEINVIGTLNLLAAAEPRGVGP